MKRRQFLTGMALTGFALPVMAEEGQGVGIILVGAFLVCVLQIGGTGFGGDG